MQGLMMDAPLLVSSVLEHAARVHGTTEIVARTPKVASTARPTPRRTPRQAARQGAGGAGRAAGRSGRLARLEHAPSFRAVLRRLGSGAVLHTINPRLFEEQLVYIVNHAEDSWICVDAATLAIAEKLAPQPRREGLDLPERRARAAEVEPRAAALRGAARRRGRRLRMAAVRRESRPRSSATPRARPASPRAWSTRTVRRS